MRVEKIVGKGENAGYQRFLLFPQCFQKASFPEASKGVIVWEWVNTHASTLIETIILYTDGQTDRLIPEYPRKHSFRRGVIKLSS